MPHHFTGTAHFKIRGRRVRVGFPQLLLPDCYGLAQESQRVGIPIFQIHGLRLIHQGDGKGQLPLTGPCRVVPLVGVYAHTPIRQHCLALENLGPVFRFAQFVLKPQLELEKGKEIKGAAVQGIECVLCQAEDEIPVRPRQHVPAEIQALHRLRVHQGVLQIQQEHRPRLGMLLQKSRDIPKPVIPGPLFVIIYRRRPTVPVMGNHAFLHPGGSDEGIKPLFRVVDNPPQILIPGDVFRNHFIFHWANPLLQPVFYLVLFC